MKIAFIVTLSQKYDEIYECSSRKVIIKGKTYNKNSNTTAAAHTYVEIMHMLSSFKWGAAIIRYLSIAPRYLVLP